MNTEENTEEKHKCIHCDYKSKWKHNITRHMVIEHYVPICSNDVQICSNFVQICSNFVQICSNFTESRNPLPNQCVKCCRAYSHKCRFSAHIAIVPSITCQYCNKNFKCSSSTYVKSS